MDVYTVLESFRSSPSISRAHRRRRKYQVTLGLNRCVRVPEDWRKGNSQLESSASHQRASAEVFHWARFRFCWQISGSCFLKAASKEQKCFRDPPVRYAGNHEFLLFMVLNPDPCSGRFLALSRELVRLPIKPSSPNPRTRDESSSMLFAHEIE
jgi:hypothetical protein